MKAIRLTAYGNPAQNLRMVEVSEPNAPSASEALVRMEYAPIHYSDLLLANGVYFLNPKLPSVIGGEGAGIVETIGPGVTSVKVGDRVAIPFGTFTWSEKVLAPARDLFVVPPSVDAKTASMLNINPTTAVLLLDEFVKLKPKDWIVLNAANSQVARCLIAIGKSRDLIIVGIVRRPEVIPEIEKLVLISLASNRRSSQRRSRARCGSRNSAPSAAPLDKCTRDGRYRRWGIPPRVVLSRPFLCSERRASDFVRSGPRHSRSRIGRWRQGCSREGLARTRSSSSP
jgi:NADPH:quinone reductase-like Zn-dependent oxidoreductase